MRESPAQAGHSGELPPFCFSLTRFVSEILDAARQTQGKTPYLGKGGKGVGRLDVAERESNDTCAATRMEYFGVIVVACGVCRCSGRQDAVSKAHKSKFCTKTGRKFGRGAMKASLLNQTPPYSEVCRGA